MSQAFAFRIMTNCKPISDFDKCEALPIYIPIFSHELGGINVMTHPNYRSKRHARDTEPLFV